MSDTSLIRQVVRQFICIYVEHADGQLDVRILKDCTVSNGGSSGARSLRVCFTKRGKTIPEAIHYVSVQLVAKNMPVQLVR